MWDAMKYAIHSHYTQYFETSIRIQTSYMNMKSIPIWILRIVILKRETYTLIMNIKVHISIQKIIISI